MAEIKYLYLRDANGKNHGVVAYDVVGRSVGSVTYGLSTCNAIDSFDKEIGKALATKRLGESPNLLGVARNSCNVDIVSALLKKISRSEMFPTHAKKIARSTLIRKYR
jgi:hypothetical protein